MASGGTIEIDDKLLNVIKQIEERLKKVSKNATITEKSIKHLFDGQTVSNANKVVQTLGKLQKELENVGNNNSKSMKNTSKQARKAADDINKLIEVIKKQQSETNNTASSIVSSSTTSTSFADAMSASRNAKTLEADRIAIEKLKQAREKLNRQDKDYKKNLSEINSAIAVHNRRIQEATGASERFNRAHRDNFNIVGQLKQRLVAVFGLSAIKDYISKLVKVRAEFELQHKALAIIIQDSDKANKLWRQTTELALKSPFSVRQLITYTKQLAAYRIETERLHDTTKMLADVSAGLGVDMQRLILAYGQIRAAKYLRGTELRQLTEAGIPMLEELSKYFTEIEGRAISAGDVLEMISKRLVDFGDVQAIFQRMTSEGGTFYNMQEEQAKTLHGQISNLHDSIDLMLNDIGASKDGTMKEMVQTARTLVDNWAEVAFSLQNVVIVLGAWKLLTYSFNKGIKGTVFFLKKADEATLLWNSSVKAHTASTLKDIQALTWQQAKTAGLTRTQWLCAKATMYLQGALRGLATIGFNVAIVAGIGLFLELIRKMTQASRAAEELKENLNSILAEDSVAFEGKVDNFTNLATRLGELNAGTLERKEIIGKLNSEYGEFLNFTVTELTTTKQLIEAYDEVVKKMKEKAALQSFEKGVAAIEESYGNALKDAKEDFYDLFKGKSIKAYKYSDKEGIIPTKKEIDDIYALIQAKTGELKAEEFDSLQEQQDIIQGIVKDYYGKDFFLSRDVGQSIELMDILIDKKKKEEELQESINTQYKEVLKSREANVELEKLQAEYAVKRKQQAEDSAKSEFERKKILQQLADEEQIGIIDIKLRFNLISPEEAEEQKNAIKNWATELTKSINSSIQNEVNADGVFSEEELSKVLINRDMQKTQSISDYLKSIESSWKTQNEIISEQISLKSAGVKINEGELSRAIKLEELYRKTANVLGVELEKKESISEESRIAINNLIEEEKHHITIEQAYKGVDHIISELKKKETEYKSIIEQLNSRKEHGLTIDEERLRLATEDYLITKKKLDLLDKETKTPIKDTRAAAINAKLDEKYQIQGVDLGKDEVTLLSEANSEKEKAIAYEAQLKAMKSQTNNVSAKELELASEAVKQWTLRWKLLGGTEKTAKSGGRTTSLYDERIKVINDMSKKYEELRKLFGEDEAIAGAFEAYKDAFADAYKDISWVDKNVKTMTPEQFVNKVLNFPDKNKIVEFLDTLSKEPMKAFEKIKVELAKGEYVYEMRVDAKTESDKDLTKKIESMFEDYEISLEVQKMGLSAFDAKDMFNLDVLNLEQLKQQLRDAHSEFIGKDKEEEYKKFFARIYELEEEQRIEQMKKYSKYLSDSMTERVKLKKEELAQLAELEKMNFTDEQKALIRNSIQQESQAKMNKLDWEEFKNSDMYIRIFQDIDGASTKTLKHMRDKLAEMKSQLKNLDPKEVKAIVSEMEKIDEALSKKNPFKTAITGLDDYIKAVKNAKEIEDKYLEGQQKEDDLERQENLVSNMLGAEQANLKKMNESGDATELDISLQQNKIKQLQQQLLLLQQQLKKQKEINEANGQAVQQNEETKKTFTDSLKDVGLQISSAASALPQVAADLEHVFGAMDAGTKDTVESISEIGGGIGNAITGFASGNYIQGITGVTQAIAGIFDIGDKKKERAIQREIKRVEALQKEYEKLDEKIQSMYNIDEINTNYDAMKKNLNEQIASTEKMIQLENDKKKTDHARIAEYREQIEEYQKQLEELEDARIRQLGGIAGDDDYLTTSQNFVDAWLDAFRETGDGLSGLEEQFDEVFMNLVKKQVLGRGVDKMLEPLYKNLESMLEDGAMSKDDYSKFSTQWNNLAPELNEFLTNMVNDLGIADDITKKTGELSGLQEGISGITEDQADILAAYWSSVRFIVSNIEQKFTEYARQMLGTDLSTNPILNELKAQTSLLDEINDKLGSIIGHSGGAHVKTHLIS